MPHAFSTRLGGLSEGRYAGLNLDDREDDAAVVHQNRALLAASLGFPAGAFARLHQVHGTEVVRVNAPGVWTGDALVTDTPGILLAIGTADCYPLLLADESKGILGAAHAGWKGTVGDIAASTVRAMVELGADPDRIRAAVGPGIAREQYEVGPEVALKFSEAGLEPFVQSRQGRLYLDLAGANRFLLERARITNIWVSERCSTEEIFYSYRRDAGRTGRMWAVIGRPAEAR